MKFFSSILPIIGLASLLNAAQAPIKWPGSWANVQFKLNEDFISAAINGNKKLVEENLNKGADVNAKSKFGSYTALMNAAWKGDSEIVQLLLDKNANVYERNIDRSTAFLEAAKGGHINILQRLLDRGANINEQNNQGDTSLIEAARQGNELLAQFLLDKEANVNIQDTAGNNALTVAAINGKKNIVKLLLEYKKPSQKQLQELQAKGTYLHHLPQDLIAEVTKYSPYLISKENAEKALKSAIFRGEYISDEMKQFINGMLTQRR